MRQLLSFACTDATLAGTLDHADNSVGMVIVTGGSQTRIGSHRMFERLALRVAEAGHPCFRFDRRGVGDSDGGDPGYRGNGSDIAAAVAAFRKSCPEIRIVVGFGLCDGGTSLAFSGASSGLSGLILVNPWFVEAESGAPPAAAIRHHYRKQMFSREGWKKILTGSISYDKLLRGVAKILRREKQASLAAEMAAALAAGGLPVEMILASNDATAIAAADAWKSVSGKLGSLRTHVTRIESDSHTFARPDDFPALLAATLGAIQRLKA